MSAGRLEHVRTGARLVSARIGGTGLQDRFARESLSMAPPAVRILGPINARPLLLRQRQLVRTLLAGSTQGPPGSPDFAYMTAAPVGGHRVVAVEADGRVRHADPTIADDFFRVAGISTHAAVADAAVSVRNDGILNFEGWTWTPGQPVFAAAGGLITQSPLGVGALIQIGAALSATSIYVRVERPILH